MAWAAAAEGEGEAADDALRRPTSEPFRIVDTGRHLPAPEAAHLVFDARALDAVGPAAARAAGDQSENEAGAFGGPAVDARAHRQGAVPAVDRGAAILDGFELGAPDERGVAEDPGVLVAAPVA